MHQMLQHFRYNKTSVLNWVSPLTRNLARLNINVINFKNFKTFKITGNDALFEVPDVNENLIPLGWIGIDMM
jgi:hypothetical protein